MSSDTCAPILLHLVSSCLPDDLLKLRERSSSKILFRSSNEKNTSKYLLKNLLTFSKLEIEGEQKVELVITGFGNSSAKERVGLVLTGFQTLIIL